MLLASLKRSPFSLLPLALLFLCLQLHRTATPLSLSYPVVLLFSYPGRLFAYFSGTPLILFPSHNMIDCLPSLHTLPVLFPLFPHLIFSPHYISSLSPSLFQPHWSFCCLTGSSPFFFQSSYFLLSFLMPHLASFLLSSWFGGNNILSK